MLQRNRTDKQRASLKDTRPDYGPPPFESGTRQWVIACLLLFASAFALTWPWLFGFVTVPWDAKAHFQPQAAFLAQSLHSGQSPFWTPYVFAGHPQIADPQSLIFSPPHLVMAMLTPNPGFILVDMISFGTLVFGALGIIGFGRDRRWHPAAALIAAIAFAFGGASAWRIQHTGQIMSLAYFPWSLWMLDRGLRLGSARYGALAGFFAALTVLDPDQVSFLSLIVLTGYVLAHWLGGPGILPRMRASLRPLATGALVGIAIITLQILMVLSFADGSNRAKIEIEDALLGSLHPTNLLSFVIANLFGTIGPGRDFWGAPSSHWPYIVHSWLSRNMTNVYMGLLPALGALVWLGSRAAYSRRGWVLAVMFLLMVAYALGRYTPVFTLFYQLVPGTDLFRRPADATFFIGAIGALIGGYGVNELLRRAPEGLSRAMWTRLGIVLGLFFVAGIGLATWLGRLAYAWRDIAIAALTVAVSLAVLAYAVRHARRAPMRITALLALCLTADLAWNIRPNHSTALEPERYEFQRPDTRNDTIAFLKERMVQDGQRRDRAEFAGVGFDWPNAPLIHKIESTLGYNPLRIGSYGAATGARDHVAGWDQRQFSPMMPSYHAPFANLLGLRFIATPVPIEKIDLTLAVNPLPLVARTKDAYIYENPDTLPRVMFVPQGVALDQDKLVETGEWPSTDFRKIVFVEPSALPLPRGGTSGEARITRYENTLVEIEVAAPDGGMLVLNDTWHPWWFATVDGMPTKVLRANGVFRAIVLPHGAKKVTFRFEPVRGLIRRHLLRSGVIVAAG